MALFDKATDLALREVVAKALLGKAAALDDLGDHDAELAAHAQVVARFNDAPEPILRELVVEALSTTRSSSTRSILR